MSSTNPAQLPPRIADFTGRQGALERSEAALAPRPGAVPVVALCGMGGVGKTALAVQVAHRAKRDYPDGQLYCDLRGAEERPAAPLGVLGGFLRALGVPEELILEGLEERAAQFRSALAGRSVLVVLDNARDAEQIRPLLPGGPGGAVLITSRSRPAQLPGIRLVELEVLDPGEALALLGRVAGEERVAAERGAAMDVVTLCGLLPLAVRIVGARLASRPSWTLAGLAERLADERGRLDELRSGDLAVEACFEVGYRQLTVERARTLRMLALPGLPGFSLPAAAAALKISEEAAEELVESLVDVNLLESSGPGRYRYHDLVRLFAGRHAGAGERRQVLQRLLGFQLASARNAIRTLQPGDPLPDRLPVVTVAGEHPASATAAGDWLFEEYQGIFTLVEQSADLDLEAAAGLLLAMETVIDYCWDARGLTRAAEAVREVAYARREPNAAACAEYVLGVLAWRERAHERAEGLLCSAATLCRTSGDMAVLSLILEVLALVDVRMGRLEAAMARADEALLISLWHGDRQREAAIGRTVGEVRLAGGDPEGAVVACRRSLDLFRELGDRAGAAHAAYKLAIALREAGHAEEALARHSESLAQTRSVRMLWGEAYNLLHMAKAFLALGRPRQAAEHAELALRDFRRSSLTYDHGRTRLELGRALSALGEEDRALGHLRVAHRLFTQVGADEAHLLADQIGPGCQ